MSNAPQQTKQQLRSTPSPSPRPFFLFLSAARQVLAARPGVVVAFCDHFGEGGMKQSLRPRANFVALRHGDGTYTRYVHLKRDGVLVQLGQVITKKLGVSLLLVGPLDV